MILAVEDEVETRLSQFFLSTRKGLKANKYPGCPNENSWASSYDKKTLKIERQAMQHPLQILYQALQT